MNTVTGLCANSKLTEIMLANTCQKNCGASTVPKRAANYSTRPSSRSKKWYQVAETSKKLKCCELGNVDKVLPLLERTCFQVTLFLCWRHGTAGQVQCGVMRSRLGLVQTEDAVFDLRLVRVSETRTRC